MINLIKKIDVSGLNNPNLFFYLFLVVFFVDSCINYFVKIPVFVSVSMLVLPGLWFFSYHEKGFRFYAVIIILFIVTALAHNLIYGFHKKNISDLLFILLFVSTYFYFNAKGVMLKKSTIHAFVVVITVMFGFTFFNFNSDTWRQNHPLYENILKQREGLIGPLPIDSSLISNYNTTIPDLFDEHKPVDSLETFRNYHNGLFRLPHIAAYFFSFSLLFFGFSFQKTRKWFFMVIAVLMLFLLLFTGVRSALVAMIAAMMIFWIRRLKWPVIIVSFIMIAGILILRHPLYEFFGNTFLGQYFALLITLVDNFGGFSRLLMWKSWYYEMVNFSITDLFTGKGFVSSLQANIRNIFFKEWFHSDPLSIVFSYGLLGLAGYAVFLYKIYDDNRKTIQQNVFIFTFYFGMIFLSLINGFYYFFPVFLIYVFLIMNNEQSRRNESGFV